MEMDYKIAEEREENGELVYQRVRYYAGETTTQDEMNYVTRQIEPRTAYRRTVLLEEVEYFYG